MCVRALPAFITGFPLCTLRSVHSRVLFLLKRSSGASNLIRGEFLWSPQTACSLAAGEDFYMQTCFALLIGLSLMVGESSRRDFSVLVRSTTLHLLSWLEQSLEGGHFKRSLSRLVTTGAGPASTLVCSRGPRLRDRAVPDVLFCTQDRLVSSGSLPGPPRLLGTLLGDCLFPQPHSAIQSCNS